MALRSTQVVKKPVLPAREKENRRQRLHREQLQKAIAALQTKASAGHTKLRGPKRTPVKNDGEADEGQAAGAL
jgi:hypothetical protein